MDEDFQLRYMKLADLVRNMLAAQKAYFRSNKDMQLLKKSKALEAEVDAIVNPKPAAQSTFDWLAQ
jgi:hypothetical protein